MGARGSWALGRLALGRLGFGGEEMPHRAPDVLEVVERVTAGGAAGRLQLREQLAGFGGQLPRQPRGHLHVPVKQASAAMALSALRASAASLTELSPSEA